VLVERCYGLLHRLLTANEDRRWLRRELGRVSAAVRVRVGRNNQQMVELSGEVAAE
jgi:hypothetical protein